MSDLAIKVEGLSKSFRLGHRLAQHRFSELLENLGRNLLRLPSRLFKPRGIAGSSCAPEYFLGGTDDVSFEVHTWRGAWDSSDVTELVKARC